MAEDAQNIEVTNPVLGSLKVSSANLNTIFTVFGFILTALIAWVLWFHTGESKDANKAVAIELKEANHVIAVTLKESNKELGTALKELTVASREQNCLLSIPLERRQENVEMCKRISR